MRAGARSGALRGGKGSGNMDGCVAGRGGFPASFAVLRRKIFCRDARPFGSDGLFHVRIFSACLRMLTAADGGAWVQLFWRLRGTEGGHLTLCAVLRHSCLGFSSSARLRTREHCAFLRAAAPRREDVWGAAPYPARELSSLDLPLFQPLRKKETAPFCSRRVPVLPRSSGVFNSSCISFAVISGPPCFAAQSFHTFSPQPSFQREQ